MGMFSRKASSDTTNRPSSDDQLIEMRNKARRRLIGAVVLVLAAVVLIPIFLSDQGNHQTEQVVAVIPSIVPPSEEQYRLSETLEMPVFESNVIDHSEQEAGFIESSSSNESLILVPDVINPVVPKEVAPKAEVKPEPEPKPKPKPAKVESGRSDDGAVALALLEGRQPPPKPAPMASSQQGSFVLQIAAYSTQKDAEARRAKLVSSGVSNAYVESAVVGGKSTYRLRVGPFPSRQAVQAAQARLRSLGYENSFISSK